MQLNRESTKTKPLSKEAVIARLKEETLAESGRILSDSEAEKAYAFIELATEIFLRNCVEKASLLKQLAAMPDGFHYEKPGRTCVICKEQAYGKDSWYDAYGLKCVTCQEAINKKIIPAFIAADTDSYYTDTDLEINLNISRKLINAFVKTGLLKARIIPCREGAGAHFRLFLLKDNRGFLPPRKVFRDTGCPVERLAKYGISDYMQRK